MFPNEDVAHDYAMQQAIFYEAFNRIKYNQLKDSRFLENGIAHDFSKAIMATTRGTKEKATLQIFPKESHFPHYGICTIDKNGRWRISRYSDIQNSETGYYIPRFHEQYDFPFYYEELSREIPDHDLNSLKCHTQIVTMRDGQKVVLKFSTENHEDGTQILTKEIDRIREMKNKGIKIVPDIIYTKQDTDTNVAYVMEYIDGKTLEEILLKNPELTIEEFKEILNHFLNTLSTEMYDVGFSEKPEDYIKRIHGGRIQDIKNTDDIRINSINGTIEHNGKFSDETVRTINEISSRGISIACITGKNEERAMQLLSKMGIDMSKIALYTQNGAMCYQNGEIIYERDLPSNVRNNVKAMLPSEQDILVREDNCRVNVVSTDDQIAFQTIERLKNVRGIEIVTSSHGYEIEILPENINKFYALRDFAKRNNLAPSCVIRIGNEPYGNDNSILNTDSSLIIEGEKQCEAIFKALAESLTKGAIQISKDIKLDERFCLRDFQYIPSEQLEELSEYAQSVAKDFYPAFAIKQRLSEEDIKRLDYKWAICDGKKPIGFTFAYEINKSGVYNVGMYMLPEYTGNGIGPKTMNQIFEFGKNQIYGFKGIRERVAETNKPSRKLKVDGNREY